MANFACTKFSVGIFDNAFVSKQEAIVKKTMDLYGNAFANSTYLARKNNSSLISVATVANSFILRKYTSFPQYSALASSCFIVRKYSLEQISRMFSQQPVLTKLFSIPPAVYTEYIPPASSPLGLSNKPINAYNYRKSLEAG